MKKAKKKPSLHECRRRVLHICHRDEGSVLSIGFRPIPVTDVLYVCDGCGEYSTGTLTGSWTLADLDTGNTARRVPHDPPPA